MYKRFLKLKLLDAKNLNFNQMTYVLTFVPANNYKLLCEFTYGWSSELYSEYGDINDLIYNLSVWLTF